MIIAQSTRESNALNSRQVSVFNLQVMYWSFERRNALISLKNYGKSEAIRYEGCKDKRSGTLIMFGAAPILRLLLRKVRTQYLNVLSDTRYIEETEWIVMATME